MSPTQTQSPKQLIQSLYAAFGRGDIPAVLAGLSADVTWFDEGPANVPFAGIFRGQDGVASFFQKLGATVQFEEFVTDAFVAEGDRVVVLGRWTGRATSTGRTAKSDFAHSWIVREGKAVRFQAFGDTAAVGSMFN